MFGIAGVSGTQNLSSLLQTSSGDIGKTEATSEEQRAKGSSRMVSRIDQALEAAGVDEETADAIKSDIKAALKETFSSGDMPPDREAVKDAIDSVFAEYGLDANSILGESAELDRIGGWSPPPGGSESGLFGRTADDDAMTLIELLQNYQQQDVSSSDQADLLVDSLFGVDEMA